MKTFKSRIGWELWGPVGLLFFIMGYFSFLRNVWPVLILLTVLVIFITMMIINTSYTISSDSKLIIRCWFLSRQEIDIHSIRKIERSTNPISSPAASLIGRLEVQYGNGNYVIISPNDKKTFIDNLLHINKSILVKEVF